MLSEPADLERVDEHEVLVAAIKASVALGSFNVFLRKVKQHPQKTVFLQKMFDALDQHPDRVAGELEQVRGFPSGAYCVLSLLVKRQAEIPSSLIVLEPEGPAVVQASCFQGDFHHG